LGREQNIKMANMGFICSLFVVCQHLPNMTGVESISYWIGKLIFNGLCQIAVPYFFIASGYMLARHVDERGWWLNALSTRFKSVVCPFWMWNLLYFFFGMALSSIADYLHGGSNLANCLSLHSIARVSGFHFLERPFLIQFWYLRSLFLFVVVSPIFVWVIGRRKWCLLCLVSLFLLGLLFPPAFTSRACFDIFRTYTFSFYGLFWFVLGIALRRFPVKFQINKLISVFALFISLLILILDVPSVTFHVPFALIGVWGLMPEHAIGGLLPLCSFEIYATHGFVIKLLYCFGLKKVDTDVAMIIQCIVVFSVTILVSIGLARFFPGWSRCAMLYTKRRGDAA